MYPASVLTVPEVLINDINKIFSNFIWKGNPRVKRTVTLADRQDGGLGLIDFNCMQKAAKIMWIKRYFMMGSHLWKSYLDNLCLEYGGSDILLKSFYSKNDINVKSPFYKEILQLWAEIPKDFSDMFIWNNQNIKIGNKIIWDKEFYEIGIHYISDLYDGSGKLIPFNVYLANGIALNKYLLWRGIIDGIPADLKDQARTSIDIPRNDLYILNRNITIQTISSKTLYLFFVDKIRCRTSIGKINLSHMYDILDDQWNTIYNIPFKCTIDTRLWELQYKILQNYIVLNPFLLKCKKSQTELCTFCALAEVPTIPHFAELSRIYVVYSAIPYCNLKIPARNK